MRYNGGFHEHTEGFGPQLVHQGLSQQELRNSEQHSLETREKKEDRNEKTKIVMNKMEYVNH